MDPNVEVMAESVFSSVKKLVGIHEDDPSFDLDIMLNINAALSTLYQLGVLEMPYTVTSPDETYSDMMPSRPDDVINMTKMYLVYKVKLGFDNNGVSSSVIETIKQLKDEAEWRLMTACNPPTTYK